MVGKNKRKRNNKKNALKKANLLGTKGQDEREDLEGEGDENEEDERPAKRSNNEEDSDTEDKPKKKKKKQPIPESGDKKGKQSIRQMKREKHSQRLAQLNALTKDQLKSQCLNYLSQWKHDKQNWKFMKCKQVWLFKNKFSSALIDDSSWKTLLEYFESAQGNVRNLLLDDANKIIKQMDEWTESQKEKNKLSTENEDETTDESKAPEKPDDIAYKRARDLIQCLH